MGASVAMCSRTAAELERVADEIRGLGSAALGVTADAMSLTDTLAAARTIEAELGPMAVLLASEDARSITGQVISVDGGYGV